MATIKGVVLTMNLFVESQLSFMNIVEHLITEMKDINKYTSYIDNNTESTLIDYLIRADKYDTNYLYDVSYLSILFQFISKFPNESLKAWNDSPDMYDKELALAYFTMNRVPPWR